MGLPEEKKNLMQQSNNRKENPIKTLRYHKGRLGLTEYRDPTKTLHCYVGLTGERNLSATLH